MGLLGDIFGPSKAEIWAQVAADMGGHYEDGGIFGTDVLRYRVGGWEMTLDTHTVSSGKSSTTYTRLRAPFMNADGLQFTVYDESIFSPIGKLFGMQDIQLGDEAFDNRFVVQGNNEEKMRLLLKDPDLKRRMHSLSQMRILVKDDEGWFGATFPEGVDELYYECHGTETDPEVIKDMFDLFTLVLDRLVRIDSAYADDPRVEL